MVTPMSAEICSVASEERPDLNELAGEFFRLEHRRNDLLRLHDKLTEQLMAFPNDFRRSQAPRSRAGSTR
jgi:hypothetical protein